VLLQQVGYSTAKCHVIEKQRAKIMFPFMFDKPESGMIIELAGL